jgi:hypothetical protein
MAVKALIRSTLNAAMEPWLASSVIGSSGWEEKNDASDGGRVRDRT